MYMNKEITFGYAVVIGVGVVLAVGSWVVDDIRGSGRATALDDFQACMIFNAPGSLCADSNGRPYVCSMAKATYEEATEHCLKYARNN